MLCGADLLQMTYRASTVNSLNSGNSFNIVRRTIASQLYKWSLAPPPFFLSVRMRARSVFTHAHIEKGVARA